MRINMSCKASDSDPTAVRDKEETGKIPPTKSCGW